MSFTCFAQAVASLKSFLVTRDTLVSNVPSSSANTVSVVLPGPVSVAPRVADSGRIAFGAAARPARR